MEHYLKVGFFGGTFDPIHFGHLNLCISLLEIHKLDQVLFCPANLSPLKEDAPPIATCLHRVKMAELAISDISQFSLLNLEVEREGASYTVDTLEELVKQRAKDQFFLILGEDVLQDFPRWKQPEKLLQLAHPLIGVRPGCQLLDVAGLLKSPLQSILATGITPIHQMEISSTELKDRLKKKMYCGHLIPRKVLDFIEENSVY